MALFGSDWGEDDDIGPLSHLNDEFSYDEYEEMTQTRQKICDECGLYYKTGCSMYVSNRFDRCQKQMNPYDK